MRRRAALRALAGLGAGTVAFPARAGAQEDSETPTETPPPPTARPDTYEPLARLPLTGAKEAVVGPAGRYAYVAVTDGFAVVNLTDPAAPQVVHENRAVGTDLRNGPLQNVFDLKLDGDLLAVVAPAEPADGFRGLVTFDVSEPTDPERIAVYESGFFNHNCFVEDGVAYLCGNGDDGNPLVIVDARAGEELGRWSITEEVPAWNDVRFPHWPLHDVWVHDDYAYLAQWDAGTWIVDITDFSEPEFVTRLRGQEPAAFTGMSDAESRRASVQPPGNVHFVTVSDDGSLLGIGVESWDADADDGRGGPGSIYLYDNTSPEAPQLVATIDPPPTPDATLGGVWTTSHNFEIRGDLLITSWYRGGVRVFDVGDPSAPKELAAWRDSARTSFWTAQYATERSFIAASRRNPRVDRVREADGAALYTFPNPAYDTPTPSPSPARAAEEPTGTSTAGPGFGVTGALAALVAAGWMAWRRQQE